MPNYPTERIPDLYALYEQGTEAITYILRQPGGITIDNNCVHIVLQEYDTVTGNPDKQGRKHPWVRWERDYSLITVHLNWHLNDHDGWCLAVEDDASRKILGMIETESRSGAASVELLAAVREKTLSKGETLEVIADHGPKFYTNNRDRYGEANYAFETYLAANKLKHTICAVGRPQPIGKIERFFQIYEKHRSRFDTLDEFLEYCNTDRPH